MRAWGWLVVGCLGCHSADSWRDVSKVFSTLGAASEAPIDVPVVALSLQGRNPVMAASSSQFLVVWEDQREALPAIYAARVSAAGALLDSAGILVARAARNPSVTSDGVNFLVVFESGGDISGARISSAGTLLDWVPLNIAVGVGTQQTPSVDFDGTDYFVVWADDNLQGTNFDIFGTRVSPAGIVAVPRGSPLVTSTTVDRTSPAMAFDGNNHLLVYERSFVDLEGVLVTKAGAAGATFSVTAAANTQQGPAAAFDGSQFVVAWGDYRGGLGNSDVYGARISTAGTVLDAAGIAISNGVGSQYAVFLSAASGQTLVLWSDTRAGPGPGNTDVYGSRWAASGVVLDPSGFAIDNRPSDQFVACGAHLPAVGYFVAWYDTTSVSSVVGVRVSDLGAVLDATPQTISLAANTQRAPVVAASASQYFVVWEDLRSNTGDIYGSRVWFDGGLRDDPAIAISTAGGSQMKPSVASDGTNFFVVWEDGRNGVDGGSGDVYGARVQANGTLLDPNGLVVSATAQLQSAPSVAFGSGQYFVVWTDNRAGITAQAIYGSRVSTAGSILDPSGLPISTTPGGKITPHVAAGTNQYLVAWVYLNASGQQIWAARVNSAGLVLDSTGFAVSKVATLNLRPRLAYGNNVYLVAWEDARFGPADVFASRITALGEVLDDGGFSLAGGPASQSNIALEFNGAEFLAVWAENSRDVYGAVFDGGGVSPAVWLATGLTPAIQPRGTEGLLVYTRFDEATTINAMRIKLRLLHEDAGSSDAGTSDAGTSDAGTSDAGTSDAGTSDAGTSDAGARHYRVGCSSVGGPTLFLFALLTFVGRRERPRAIHGAASVRARARQRH